MTPQPSSTRFDDTTVELRIPSDFDKIKQP